MRDTLNADILADWLRISVPPSLGGLVAMVCPLPPVLM
jgi:hypothetical protein